MVSKNMNKTFTLLVDDKQKAERVYKTELTDLENSEDLWAI